MIVLGMFAGWLAQIILGRDGYRANWPLALAAGIIGSFVGGTIGSLLFEDGFSIHPSGLIGSVVGAVIVTAGYWWWQRNKQHAA